MKKVFKVVGRKLLKSTIKQKKLEKLIKWLCKEFNINLLEMAHNSMGIMKYQNPDISGENFVIQKVILSYFLKSSNKKPILFDVGANKGNFSLDLSEQIPFAKIYAFEPNPKTYALLRNSVSSSRNINCFQIGFGSTNATTSIYTYRDDLDSEHASVFKEVLQDFHKASEIEELVIEIDVLDNFCERNLISKIDFLKVDTEGFEFEVLKGSKKFLEEKRIDFIQFEFNEMNISSRVFLKDFYEILKGYKMFRLDSDRLIPILEYNPENEIFRFQNILAIKNELNF